MTDNPTPEQAPNESAPEPQSTPPAEAQKTENAIPYERFKQVNDRAKELADRLDQIERERQQERENELKRQNKYEELYEETRGKLEVYEQMQLETELYKSAFNETLQGRIAQIPEDKRSLIPEGLDPINLSQWLNKNWSLLAAPSKPQPAPMDGSAGAGGGSESSATAMPPGVARMAQMAREMGYQVDEASVASWAKQARNNNNRRE